MDTMHADAPFAAPDHPSAAPAIAGIVSGLVLVVPFWLAIASIALVAASL